MRLVTRQLRVGDMAARMLGDGLIIGLRHRLLLRLRDVLAELGITLDEKTEND